MDNNLCRICCENTGTVDIFDVNHVVNLSTKIMYCCINIRISEEDGLPTRVCSCCEGELSSAYQFVLKCEASDTKLRSYPSVKEHDCDLKPDVKVERKDVEFSENLDHENCHSSSEEVQDAEPKPDKSITLPNVQTIKTVKNKPKRKVNVKQKCNVCGQECKNPSRLAIHMRKHSENRPFACSSCDKKYKDSVGLKRHIERNHNHLHRKRKYVCEHCGKRFYTQPDVKIHMRTHTGETPYACVNCPLKFAQIGALQRHQLRHNGERTHSCSKCNKTFLTKEDVRRHQVAHSTEKKYVCTTCNIKFKYKNNLRKHTKLHSDTNNYICNYCARTFKTKGNLKLHIDKMHSDKSGYCETCSKHVANIEVHMWRHTGKKPFKCDLCSSSYYEQKSLTRHINYRHKYIDKYKCSVDGCIVTFPSQPMLEYHVAKFHESSVPYPCDRCSKGFYRRNDLTRHKMRNHRERFDV
ncbi:uncharacterized protein [Epargyreus clarus]|uniref:uncharacterized protein n=1 Tax=Epargyreus clarus TaxID=520877 RepID=UPI003C2D124D